MSRLVALGALLSSACIAQMTTMPGESFDGPRPPLTAAQRATASALEADVTRLAVTIGERNVRRAPRQLRETAAYLERRLVELRYDITRQRYKCAGAEVTNVIVERRGAKKPSEIIIIGAHYDSAEGTPGADDNASGVAVLLWLAQALAHAPPPERTVRLVFFTNEEPPWFATERMGSEVYASALRAEGADVRAMLSLETLGYFDDAPGSQHSPWPLSSYTPTTGNFIAFVGDRASETLVRQVTKTFRAHATVRSQGASIPSFVQGADWSDHGPFWRQGYRAVMVTDTAVFRNPHYHEGSDLPERLDFDALARVAAGVLAVVEWLAGPGSEI